MRNMKRPAHRGAMGVVIEVAACMVALFEALPLRAQYEVPRLEPGYPVPYSPVEGKEWNANAAFTPGGGDTVLEMDEEAGYVYVVQIGAPIVGLTSQYGIGDELPRPDGVPPDAWPDIDPNQGDPDVVQWLTFSNTNLLVAVDEGVAFVQWMMGDPAQPVPVGGPQAYVIGPNLTRRPVRLFWTEGQYVGPRVHFGNNYEVEIWYNSQIENPTNNPANMGYISMEEIGLVEPPTIFIKNSELRACAGALGRVLLTYSRRPEGPSGVRELLAYEVVDVLEPMSSTLSAYVSDRLLPKRRDYDTSNLFCEITRGAVDASGQSPDDVFVYKHTVGARNGWVWAIRPTDSPWQIEIFWKAKEKLDVVWPFEVDIYDVSWDPGSQLCALVDDERGGTEKPVLIPSEVIAEVMPYQAVPVTGNGRYLQAATEFASVDNSKYTANLPGMSTLKYSSGEDVWFESVHTVLETDPLVYQGVTNWVVGEELRPFIPDLAIVPDMYREWPGFLRVPAAGKTVLGDKKWNRYHAGLYRYPSSYPVAEVHSQIFPVNVGHLGAWWFNPSDVSVHEGMPSSIYWPSVVCDYDNDWPELPRELVIASFLGSVTDTWIPDETGSLHLDQVSDSAVLETHPDYVGAWQGKSYADGFVFESWIRPTSVAGWRGVMSMQVGSQTNFCLFVRDGLPGAAVIEAQYDNVEGNWSSVTQAWFATTSVMEGKWSHLAMSYLGGTIRFYVDGVPSGETSSAPADIMPLALDPVRLGAMWGWNTSVAPPTREAFGHLLGYMDEVRIWAGERTDSEILEYFGSPIGSMDRLRCRFDFDPAAIDPDLPLLAHPDIFGYMYAQLNEFTQVAPGITAPQTLPGKTYTGSSPEVYVQNSKSLPGYNPNEEHGLMVGGVVYALRMDLNEPDSSQPYTLVEYTPDPLMWQRAIDVYHVLPTNSVHPRFEQALEAGIMIQPPLPLRYLLPDNCENTHPDESDVPLIFRDRRRYYWAKQAGDNGGALEIGMRYFYPLQPGFFYPSLNTQPAPTTEVPWLSGLEDQGPGWELGGEPVRVAVEITWPQYVPVLQICDTLTLPKHGLPAVRGQKSVNVAYQQSLKTGMDDSVALIDPTRARKRELEKVPPNMRAMRDPRTGNTFFSDLDPDLRERLFYVPFATPEERLWLKGIFVEYPTYHYLRLNLMTPDLVEMATDPDRMAGMDESWSNAVVSLPTTRVDIPDENTPFDSLALCTPGLGTGYVSLVFNNSTNIDMVDPGDPIDMEIIRIDPDLFGGLIDIIESSNPLDKYLTLRHISDFAGRPDRWSFEWQYGEPDPYGMWPTNEASWRVLIDDEEGRYTTQFGSSGEFGLGDAWVRCRYRALDSDIRNVVGTGWSSWTEPVLCEGWIKRVLKAINPFDQRIRDYMNYALNTDLSMIQQAGQPYSGDVPLNMDALNEYGLIPIYQTVLEQSRELSIDSTTGTNVTANAICLALMLVSSRLNDLYMVLGNEAYGDAMNPSLALGTADPLIAAEATSIFAFQNLVPTLLDEELALLRGRDCSAPSLPDPSTFPVFNRLPWNFTADITHGQVAYVLNYGISDLKGDQNGVVDATDAAMLYPQGHGDAWGHYLSAVKAYYQLFRHRNFTWFPQLEGIRVGQMATTISALHEKKFAGSAAAKARAGLAIIDRTYRRRYEEGTTDTWTVQRDPIASRSWGVGEWGARVGMGSYLDWVMANALLPEYTDTTNQVVNPLAVIDRTTVPELTELVLAGQSVQHVVDMADRGLNPLGVAGNAVPFDISPAEIDTGHTHFEQVYARALESLRVAHAVFDRVQSCTAAIRDQNENRDLDQVVLMEEQAYDRQLIDIYGFPYLEDIGPGRLYPEGYIGPDTHNYSYINRYDYFGAYPLDTSVIQSTVVVPQVLGNGIRSYEPGDIVPIPLPSADPSLTLDSILQFISPSFAERYADIKSKYSEVRGALTREKVESLGIPELSALFNEAMSAYDEVEAAIFGQVEEIVAWFDGVISAPVDEIDNFISQWVGHGQELDPLQINGPNIAYVTNSLTFWVDPNGLPVKPDDYTSARRAEGEIQIALSQYVLALREAVAAIAAAEARYKKVLAADARFRNTIGARITGYYDEVNSLDALNSLEQIVEVVNKAIALAEKVYNDGRNLYVAVEAAIPQIAGMSFDIGAAVRGPAAAVSAASSLATTIQKLINFEQVTATERDIKMGQEIIALNAQGAAIFGESTQLAKEVVDTALDYVQSLDALDVALQKAETFRMHYGRAIAHGDMLQVEREQKRAIWATDLTMQRYRNMAYQIIRNDELARYEEAYSMAARYVYLAAKAYDYETGLLRQDGAVGEAGRTFLSQVVRARALGRFDADGNPLPGGSTGDPGLADIMARMAGNWLVLDGRLSFNNPQTETGMFSLRRELFRVPESPAFDTTWTEVLSECVVDDLHDLMEYRTFCLPFTPSDMAEPALVIPFSSTIDFRSNFFGMPLGPGDNAYDSTHFATKIRSVGVWFSNYQRTMLANQPRVYLVPVGEDRMRVPDGIGETVRSWTILDQALPIPFPISNESWMEPDWDVGSEVLGGEYFARRRYPSLRAYHDDGFNETQMTGNSRLIGRSVWNTRWLLIIPGGTLLADADSGLNQFIHGRELAPGAGVYDGEGVKDIKLFFQTYSYSGN